MLQAAATTVQKKMNSVESVALICLICAVKLSWGQLCSIKREVSLVILSPVPFFGSASIFPGSNGCGTTQLVSDPNAIRCNHESVLFDNDFGPKKIDLNEPRTLNRLVGWSSESYMMFDMGALTRITAIDISVVNVPSRSLGLPKLQIYSTPTIEDLSPMSPETTMISYDYLQNEHLLRSDRTVRNITLRPHTEVSTRYFLIRWTFTGLAIENFALSEIRFCGDNQTRNIPQSIQFQTPMEGTTNILPSARKRKPLVLTCTVANSGSFTWQWIRNGQLLSKSNNTKIVGADGTRTSTLTIFNPSARDGNIVYVCHVSTDLKRSIVAARQFITLPSGGAHQIVGNPPRFTSNGQPPRDVTFHIHTLPNYLILPCTVTGVPTPFVTWYRDNTALDQSFVRSNGTLIQRLEVNQLSVQGILYYCTATNYIGRHSAGTATLRSRNVNVTLAFFGGFRTPPARTVEVETLVGGLVGFECDFLPSNPAPQVEWRTTFDEVGTEFRDSKTVIRYLDGGRYLLIRNLTKAQRSRSYYCIVTNFLDNSSGLRPRSPTTYRLGRDIPALKLVPYIELGTKYARVGEEIEFVYAAGQADAEGRSRDVDLVCEGGSFVSLRIVDIISIYATLNKNAMKVTEVTFTCTVPLHAKVVVGTIIVLKDESLITNPLDPYQLDRERRTGYGPRVVFDCVIAADQPLNGITWYYNGLVFRSGADNKIILENGSLFIEHPTVSHFGIYQCYAVNMFRDDVRVWFLEVRNEEQIIPVKYSYVYFSNFESCFAEHTALTCDDPTATFLFDGLRPNVVRVYGKDKAVDGLVSLRATEAIMTFEFNSPFGLTGIRRAEIELLNCESSGISMEMITFSAGRTRPIVIHPHRSCNKLVKVCLPIPANITNEMTFKFNSRKSSDWIAISDINFFTEFDSCEHSSNADVLLEIEPPTTPTPPQVPNQGAPICTIATIADVIATTIATTIWNGPTTRDENSKNESSLAIAIKRDSSASAPPDTARAIIAAILAFIGGIIFTLFVELIIWKVRKIFQTFDIKKLDARNRNQNQPLGNNRKSSMKEHDTEIKQRQNQSSDRINKKRHGNKSPRHRKKMKTSSNRKTSIQQFSNRSGKFSKEAQHGRTENQCQNQPSNRNKSSKELHGRDIKTEIQHQSQTSNRNDLSIMQGHGKERTEIQHQNQPSDRSNKEQHGREMKTEIQHQRQTSDRNCMEQCGKEVIPETQYSAGAVRNSNIERPDKEIKLEDQYRRKSADADRNTNVDWPDKEMSGAQYRRKSAGAVRNSNIERPDGEIKLEDQRRKSADTIRNTNMDWPDKEMSGAQYRRKSAGAVRNSNIERPDGEIKLEDQRRKSADAIRNTNIDWPDKEMSGAQYRRKSSGAVRNSNIERPDKEINLEDRYQRKSTDAIRNTNMNWPDKEMSEAQYRRKSASAVRNSSIERPDKEIKLEDHYRRKSADAIRNTNWPGKKMSGALYRRKSADAVCNSNVKQLGAGIKLEIIYWKKSVDAIRNSNLGKCFKPPSGGQLNSKQLYVQHPLAKKSHT